MYQYLPTHHFSTYYPADRCAQRWWSSHRHCHRHRPRSQRLYLVLDSTIFSDDGTKNNLWTWQTPLPRPACHTRRGCRVSSHAWSRVRFSTCSLNAIIIYTRTIQSLGEPHSRVILEHLNQLMLVYVDNTTNSWNMYCILNDTQVKRKRAHVHDKHREWSAAAKTGAAIRLHMCYVR